MRARRVVVTGSVVAALLLGPATAGWAPFLNFRGDAALFVDPERVCGDGVGDLVLYDITEDDPEREVVFDDITAASPPPDNSSGNAYPAAETLLAEASVTLTYVPGGEDVDQDNDGEPDGVTRYYKATFELRWERNGYPVRLDPGTIVQIDVDEGQEGPSTVDVEVQDCRLDSSRVWGATRWDTAVAASQTAFPEAGSAPTVLLARGDDPDGFADALSGAPLAAALGAPMLLTQPAALVHATEDELVRVLPDGGTVVLLGGKAALSQAVEDRVKALGFEVDRIAGADRTETSLAVAGRLGDPAAILLSSGAGFPDALASGVAAAHVGGVVVLTPGEARHAAIDAYLDHHHAAPRYGVGGPAARAYPEAEAIVGTTRIETAVLIAERFFHDPAVLGVARSDAFPDALAGGAHLGRLGGPLLLTPSASLAPAAADHLCAVHGTVTHAFLYGGTAALSDGVRWAVEDRVSGRACP